ncbi:hypothetical protein WICMUC_004355 [Wickerhamomyces mucosus]|uniref:Potassium channel domain-containing protein n=1 Tax=Wickerhamomyces mucosus TaxID=1378264 RepID=A0A9P8TBC5_9ASCO|nr:hypothetical protein WICMUC_004355 [Wickerhamomyces mucosus]
MAQYNTKEKPEGSQELGSDSSLQPYLEIPKTESRTRKRKQRLNPPQNFKENFQNIPQLTLNFDQDKIAPLNIEPGSFSFALWFIISVYLPVFTACVCPFTNMMSITALISRWRLDDQNHEIPETSSVLILNAISLFFGAISNISVILNFSKTLSYRLSQLISIFGFCIALVFLLSAVCVAEVRYFKDTLDLYTKSEGFWYAVITTVLYAICAFTNFLNFLGYLLRKYPPDYNLHASERGLILFTFVLVVWLSIGSAVFSKLLDMNYANGQYFAVVTITTLGYGNITPLTGGCKAFTMVFALVGVIFLGLVIAMTRSMLFSTSMQVLFWNRIEVLRKRILSKIVKEKLSITQEESFHLMRSIRGEAKLNQKTVIVCSTLAIYFVFWLIGALIFNYTEGWGYFNSVYFTFISLLTIGYGDFAPNTGAGKAFFVFWVSAAVPLMTCLISSVGDYIYSWAVSGVSTKFIMKIFNRTPERKQTTGMDELTDITSNDFDMGDEESTSEILSQMSQKKIMAQNNKSFIKSLKKVVIESKVTPHKRYNFDEWVALLGLLQLGEDEAHSLGIDDNLFWLSDSSPLRFPINESSYFSFLLFSRLESEYRGNLVSKDCESNTPSSAASVTKQLSKKDLPTIETYGKVSSGIGGAALDLPILSIAGIASKLDHGLLPANISNTTHPKDQMSTLALYPSPLLSTTSGAIQKIVPCMDIPASLA